VHPQNLLYQHCKLVNQHLANNTVNHKTLVKYSPIQWESGLGPTVQVGDPQQGHEHWGPDEGHQQPEQGRGPVGFLPAN